LSCLDTLVDWYIVTNLVKSYPLSFNKVS